MLSAFACFINMLFFLKQKKKRATFIQNILSRLYCFVGWMNANSEYFPEEGERVVVNIADIDYTQELPKLGQIRSIKESLLMSRSRIILVVSAPTLLTNTKR
jgi:hypothetical protein